LQVVDDDFFDEESLPPALWAQVLRYIKQENDGKARHVLEREVLFGIRRALGARPGWVVLRNSRGVIKTPGGARVTFGCGPNGSSDLLCCAWGMFVAIEVKRPGGRASPAQSAFIQAIRGAGGHGFVAHSVELALAMADQIDQRFREASRRPI
jgi:hypothetical protein